MTETPSLSTSEKKLLDAVRRRPGLLWYEVGSWAYPNSSVTRINLQGEPFRELTGKALHITSDALATLEAKGLVEKDVEHRYYLAGVPRPYRYRGLPCRLKDGTEATHSVCGQDALQGGGGILEWCYSLEDAQSLYAEMSRFPEQFPVLRIRDAFARVCPVAA